MRIASLINIILLITLYSCQKDAITIEVDGFLVDESSQTFIEGATISAYGKDPESNDYNFITSDKTNAEGYYSLSIDRNRYASIKIESAKLNYFEASEERILSEFNTENKNFIMLSTTAKAWARIHVINQPPNSTSDAIRIIKQKGKTGCTDCCSNDELILNGIIDTTFYCINDGNSPFSIFYEVIGSTTVNIIEVNTTSFDTTEILISY